MAHGDQMYASPYCEIKCPAGSVFRKVRSASVTGGRDASARSAEITLDNRDLSCNGLLHEKDDIKIYMGYWDVGKWLVFIGTVVDVRGDADYTIFAKDGMRAAHEIRIVKAFQDATPNDIVTYCVKEAGFTDLDLGGEQFPKRKHFVLRNASVSQAVSLVERTWGITGWGHYLDIDGKFVWKKWEAPGDSYTLATGEHIIDMQPYGSLWRLRTFLYPWIRHSDVVRVEDKRVGYGADGEEFRVERVTYSYGAHNSMTMWLRNLSDIGEVENIDVFGAFQSSF